MAHDPSRPAAWKTLGKLIASLVAVGILTAGLLLPYVGGVGIFAGKAAGKFLNTTCNLQESAPPLKTTMYARDGKTVIATLFTQDRQPVPLSDIPKYLQDALVATEDRRFYQHHGVDLRGLIRSAINTSSGDTQGGSTLTMQYVKQVRYFQAVEANDPKAEQAAIDQNLSRKMEDAQCAIEIEKRESKSQILDNYLNIAFFGENSYGIQTAAETYFGVPASQLTLGESAMLVGLLRAPSTYDPFQHLADAKARRDQVLQNLVAVGKLSQSAADKEKATPISLATKSPPHVEEGCANANSKIANAAFFCDYAKTWLENVNGIKDNTLQTGGLKIVTTLDPKIQNSAQSKMNKLVPATSPMTATLPVVDPRTGDVLAMASSKTYGTGKGQTEQPIFTKYVAGGASTFKLFALLAALQTGVKTDWPLKTKGNNSPYKPTNCMTQSPVSNGDDNVNYNETETLSSATAKSDNTFFVGMASDLLNCNLQPIVDMMTKLGMGSLQQHDPNDHPNLTYAQNLVDYQKAQELVLGNIPTSPLDITGAYAAVADGGKFNAPAPILQIQDSSGNAIPVKRSPAVQAMTPQAAAQAARILTGDTRSSTDGTSQKVFTSWYAGSNASQIAGKTGTNQAAPQTKYNAAILFAGITPDIAATAALINFDNPSAPSSGLKGIGTGKAYGDYAAQVWWDALQSTISNEHWTWPDPSQLGSIQVTNLVGMSPSDAQKALAAQGLKLTLLGGAGFQCGGPTPAPQAGTIGYFGPANASPGETITACVSNGVAQYVVPYIPPPTHHTTPPPRHGGGHSPSPSPSPSPTRHGHHGPGGH